MKNIIHIYGICIISQDRVDASIYGRPGIIIGIKTVIKVGAKHISSKRYINGGLVIIIIINTEINTRFGIIES